VTPLQVIAVLARLRPALDATAQPWCLIGSAALMIAKVPIDRCPDIDVLTTGQGAAFLENAWAEQRQETFAPDPASPFRSRFSRYAFREGAVEVMGDLTFQDAPVSVQEIAAAPFGGMRVPIPTLAEQARLLRLFGRPKDKARLALLGQMTSGD
jgi:hypothetical protein